MHIPMPGDIIHIPMPGDIIHGGLVIASHYLDDDRAEVILLVLEPPYYRRFATSLDTGEKVGPVFAFENIADCRGMGVGA